MPPRRGGNLCGEHPKINFLPHQFPKYGTKFKIQTSRSDFRLRFLPNFGTFLQLLFYKLLKRMKYVCRSVMSVIDFVAIMPYYIGLTMSDDNEVIHHHYHYHHRHHHHHIIIIELSSSYYSTIMPYYIGLSMSDDN